MLKEKILKKAINKAVKNVGEFEMWPGLFCTGCQMHLDGDIYLELKLEYNQASDGKRSNNKMWQYIEPEQVIFNHEFAKAFWKKRKKKCNCYMCKTHDNCYGYSVAVPSKHIEIEKYNNQNWEYHLQRMVLEKDPIKYLENFL